MDELKKLIAEIAGERPESIKNTDTLIGDIGFDSIMLFDLYQSILAEYNFDSQNVADPSGWNDDINVENVWKMIHEREKTSDNEFDSSVMDISDFPEVRDFKKMYIEQKDSQPYFKIDDGIPSNHIFISGKEYINFSTYNYLGLNGNEEVEKSAMDAINKFGTSVSGSRLLSGEILLHQELEFQISDFLGTEASLVEVGGHSTNVNTIGNIVNEKDLIIHDELAHNSIVEGARLSHAKRRSFKHNDLVALEKLLIRLRDDYRRVLVIVEGAYSMDGDLCPLPGLIKLKKKFGAILMIDEAHSFGTVGKNGGGVTEYFNVNPNNVDILMGTLSKACASCGGFISGSFDFINWLRFNSPGFIFSAGITPANTAAALESIKIFRKNPKIIKKLQSNSEYFLKGLRERGFNVGESGHTPIIPIVVGDSENANKISQYLFDKGINALPIIYPAVRDDQARLRFFISSTHTKGDMDKTLEVLDQALENNTQ